MKLKFKIESKNKFINKLVTGHGDPCFSNTIYNKSTQTLKFVDTKGAMTEDELWTNPYYDVAKISHSICGRYDFFNNGLFEIKIKSDFSYELDIPFNNKSFVKIFKEKAIENGFDFWTIRIYEASLFLSMLPLHIDNPYKVFGFILNAINILKEIEKMYSNYTFVFEIDGTLCPIKNKNENYNDLIPYQDMVERIRKYKRNGAKIILYTSRKMNSYNGNIGLINKYTAPILLGWLKEWNIPYDEIVYGKIWPGYKGFYVDDRTVRLDEFLRHSPAELENICKTSRCKNGE